MDYRSRDRGGHQGRGEAFGRGDNRGHRGRAEGPNRGGSGFSSAPQIFQGQVGQLTTLQSNHHRMSTIKEHGVFHVYRLNFAPEPRFSSEKSSIIKNSKQALETIYGQIYSYGNDLFSIFEVREEQIINSQFKGSQFEVIINYETSFSLSSQDKEHQKYKGKILNFIQVAIKKTLYEFQFKQVGRLPRFYLHTDLQDVANYNLRVWSGYSMAVQSFNDGIFVNIDCATKFVEKSSVLDLIRRLQKDKYSQADIKQELVPKDQNEKGLVVITMYNSKKYQIDDIRFDITPKNHIFEYEIYDPETKQRYKHKSNMVEYMNKKNGIIIPVQDQDQPTLQSNYRDITIYLIPSLCFKDGLDKNFTSDSRKMRDLQEYKLSHPEQRYERINQLIEKFQAAQILENWGLKIDANFTNVKAKQLPPPKIIDNRNNEQNWSDYEQRKVKPLEQLKLKKETWALIYGSLDFDNANNAMQMFKQVGSQHSFIVEEPQYIELPRNDNGDLFVNGIISDIDPKYISIAVVIFGKRQGPEKAKIKAQLDLMGIPSQFMCSQTIQSKGKNASIFADTLKQMSAKMGLDLYNLSLPCYKKTMVIGTDVVISKGNTIMGMTASYNLQLSKYYSRVDTHKMPSRESGQDQRSQDEKQQLITESRCQILCKFIKDSLQNYQQCQNGPYPELIVIYRDGIGGESMQDKCQEFEITRVIEVIQSSFEGYNPAIVYCFVNRNNQHRLFAKYNGQIMNPSSGTVLDIGLVENQGENTFDLQMIAPKTTVATAQPVQLRVVYNTSNLTKDQFELSTYHLCFNYVNYCGPIKVPSVCMYAKKIAQYAADNQIRPNDKLGHLLHFI
ncbi:piwi-like protein 1 [Stylonychia lemnae]|uniref:Piwi-like protein 1 n=1 Tax=Stylonychia lemnae TaxID=5949 RepID=A0A078ASB7_STYLE|nr:piwi-like protein 1 [Stylonychia lemnae]|eukprot:CDW85355.1 piwi-like protein 1 [Stylonychia lemnae]